MIPKIIYPDFQKRSHFVEVESDVSDRRHIEDLGKARYPAEKFISNPLDKSEVLTMDWNGARKHCQEKDWQWTLDLIDKYQKEMEELKDQSLKLKRQLVLRSQLNK